MILPDETMDCGHQICDELIGRQQGGHRSPDLGLAAAHCCECINDQDAAPNIQAMNRCYCLPSPFGLEPNREDYHIRAHCRDRCRCVRPPGACAYNAKRGLSLIMDCLSQCRPKPRLMRNEIDAPHTNSPDEVTGTESKRS